MLVHYLSFINNPTNPSRTLRDHKDGGTRFGLHQSTQRKMSSKDETKPLRHQARERIKKQGAFNKEVTEMANIKWSLFEKKDFQICNSSFSFISHRPFILSCFVFWALILCTLYHILYFFYFFRMPRNFFFLCLTF